MSHAFAPESMAHCAAKGHRWRHVRGWHAVGWQECYCCGQTMDGLSDLEPQQIFNPTTQQVEPYTPEPVFYTQGSRVDNCVASGPITVGEMVAAINDATERIAAVASITPKRPRSKHPPRAPVGERKRGELAEKRDRNAAVLQRIAEGVEGIEIAAEFGISPGRVSQIGRSLLDAHRNTKTQRNDAILAMITAGASPSDAARHFGLTPARISQIVRRHAPEGFVMPPMLGAEKRRALDERNAEIVRRKAAGEECKDIAAALGVCLSVVHKAMKEPKP